MTRLRRVFMSLKDLGVDVHIFNPYRTPEGRPRVIKGIVRYLLLVLQVALTRADIYHFFNVPDIMGVPLLWKKGVLLYDVRAPWQVSIRETIGSNLLGRIGELIERIMARGSDIVLSVNRPLAVRARTMGARRVIVIPNWPPSDFGPSRSREELRESLGLGDALTVLYLGKISRVEGVDLLMEIVDKTTRALPNVKFLIVGDGPHEKAFQQFIVTQKLENRVVMVGWVPHDEVANYINTADLCLLPRKRDGNSPFMSPSSILKAGEYLALGKPVIAPKMGEFSTAQYPIIPVAFEEMADAVIDFLSKPIPEVPSQHSTWDVSHRRLKSLYFELGAI